ncbi:MAG: HDOD domain-containing protein [Phycisphaeraceae bacterium]|nr:HDOD domain-containing protein [Phycisphaeraceae bacterium]
MNNTAIDATRSRRIELILRQVDSLPTLPAIAARLLALTTSDEGSAQEVIELVKADPTLTARILSLCHKAYVGVRAETITVDRAVVLLGFNAIRNAVLSVKVFEAFGLSEVNQEEAGEQGNGPYTFDRPGFWCHSLAVAITCELIAQAHPGRTDLPPGDAFVCGLLHDIGKLALDLVLPKSFARVIELAQINQGNIAEFERRVIGIDHHTAGKRLAEHWQLPHVLQDCIWLHGSSYELLPRLEHRPLIGLVSLADLIVRRQHLGFSGNLATGQDQASLIEAMRLDPEKVERATRQIFDELERRGEMLGLKDQPSAELYLKSIQRANEALGQLNAAMDRRSRAAARQARLLRAIATFQAWATPAGGVQDVLNRVASVAAELFGTGYYALLYPGVDGEPWLLCQYSQQGEPLEAQYLDPPVPRIDLSTTEGEEITLAKSAGMLLPWLADHLLSAHDLRQVRLLRLGCGWGTVAVLLHDRPSLPPAEELEALTLSWGSAVAAVAQHEGARRLGEGLAEANRQLAEAQQRLLQSETMARLGEMAAGAAHEMNNPLAVISGRSQLLAQALAAGSDNQKAAQKIVEQTHRLSDLISCLRMFADPPRAERKATNLQALLDEVIHQLRQEQQGELRETLMSVKVDRQATSVWIDGPKIAAAVRELLLNALQAGPKSSVHIGARVGMQSDTLTIQVSDDGEGMDAHVLAHALDPFFSSKAAGRRTGMGLPRAQQLAKAHGGDVRLTSVPGRGTVATLLIPLAAAASDDLAAGSAGARGNDNPRGGAL